MDLYTNPLSPFCRKVDVVLRETGQRDAVTDIPAVGHPVDSSKMPTAHNPVGKIPTLVRDDGTALFDSRVICRFLDDRAGSTLCPDRDWEVMTLESLGDGMSDAAVLMIYESRTRPEERRHAPWVEGQWSKIERALDALEGHWIEHLQAPVNIGQISVACALGYLDLRHAERNWRDGRPALAAWHAAFSQRPSMLQTHPEA